MVGLGIARRTGMIGKIEQGQDKPARPPLKALNYLGCEQGCLFYREKKCSFYSPHLFTLSIPPRHQTVDSI